MAQVGRHRRSRMRADASRNLAKVIEAARAVFSEQGPDAPVEAVARRAGVSIATVYRHFPDKDTLIAEMCVDIMARDHLEVLEVVEAHPDPWDALRTLLERKVARGAGMLLPAMVRGVPMTPAVVAARDQLMTSVESLLRSAREAGQVRPDLEAPDLAVLCSLLAGLLRGANPDLARPLQRRYLALLFDGMRGPAHDQLPGPAPTAGTLAQLYLRADPSHQRSGEHDPGWDGNGWEAQPGGAVDPGHPRSPA